MLPTINTTAKIHKKDFRQANGKNIVHLNLSVGEKNPKGEYENFYFQATFWEKGADFVNQYFNEGDFIMIKGDLKTEQYTKQDGSKGSNVIVKSPKASFVPKPNIQTDSPQHSAPQQKPKDYGYGANHTPNNNNGYNSQPAPTQQAQSTVPEIDIDENDEIPF